ncbi:MAG TPA: nicotinate (nicotinamide) nucleotide adenylyltransferase [Candidatus Krumholzibacteria bacterium]|nr:nicotinate (nicotinamide) nucleotide adenylyltransferase [Candidatus Krumholzibacteria bacterium]
MTGGEAGWDGARVGILGGTFDPPHTGHVRMAVEARRVLGLDHVFLSPAPHPPHKTGEVVSPLADRRAMLAAAIAGEDGLSLTDIEHAAGPSYTADLLRLARSRTAADIYFIMGADSLADLASWRDPGDILRLCTVVVFPRDGAPLRVPVAGDASVVVFESPVVDVSSTELRTALARGVCPPDLIAPAVADYIAQHRLYHRV